MDARAQSPSGSERRRAPRYLYHRGLVVVHLRQPGSTASEPYLVPTRNLSKTGVAFLHGGFIHSGTECVMHLITRDGAWQSVPGQVVRCRFVESNIHEVGVQFTDPIELSKFCCLERSHRVLVMGGCEKSKGLAEISRSVGCEVTEISPNCDLRQVLEGETFDAAFLMECQGGCTKPCRVRSLRKAGFENLIVAIARRSDAAQREQCLTAGCDLLLPDPPSPDSVMCVLTVADSLLRISGDARTLTENGISFLDRLPGILRTIESRLFTTDHESLEGALADLQTQANAVGLSDISKAATSLAKLIRANAPASELQDATDSLIESCLADRFIYRKVLTRHAAPDAAPDAISDAEEIGG